MGSRIAKATSSGSMWPPSGVSASRRRDPSAAKKPQSHVAGVHVRSAQKGTVSIPATSGYRRVYTDLDLVRERVPSVRPWKLPPNA